MALSNPLDLFAEFELLNFPGVLDTGGQWTIESAPSFPVTICTDCGGGYTDVSYTAAGQDVCTGIHDPLLDMLGALGSCTSGQIADGEYIFKYAILAGSCPSESLFTVNVVDGVITATFERDPAICLVEMYSEHPDTPGEKKGKFTITNNYITARLQLRQKVSRFEFDNCDESITDLSNSVLSHSYIERNATNLPTTPGFSLGMLWLSNSIYLRHVYTLDISTWDFGAKIENIRVRQNQVPNVLNLDVSGVVFPGPPGNGPAQAAYVNALRLEIADQLDIQSGSAFSSDEVAFDVGISGETVFITFICCHNPSGRWCGIDKNNYDLVYCNAEFDCGLGPGFEGVQWDFYQEIIVNNPEFTFYEVLNCKDYPTPSSCFVSMSNTICHNGTNIFDLSGCNYNVLDLVSTSAMAKVFDYDTSTNCAV